MKKKEIKTSHLIKAITQILHYIIRKTKTFFHITEKGQQHPFQGPGPLSSANYPIHPKIIIRNVATKWCLAVSSIWPLFLSHAPFSNVNGEMSPSNSHSFMCRWGGVGRERIAKNLFSSFIQNSSRFFRLLVGPCESNLGTRLNRVLF